MADLFVALGYEQPRLNIHKSGRELDLSAEHRLETRRAVAECKATADPIGGDDVNKFVGALDAERKRKGPVTGYFISLGGQGIDIADLTGTPAPAAHGVFRRLAVPSPHYRRRSRRPAPVP